LETKLYDAKSAAAAASGQQYREHNERGLPLNDYENNKSLMTTLQQRVVSGKVDYTSSAAVCHFCLYDAI